MKSCSVTIQVKATEQSFPVVLSVMLYTVVSDLILSRSHWGVCHPARCFLYDVTVFCKGPFNEMLYQ